MNKINEVIDYDISGRKVVDTFSGFVDGISTEFRRTRRMETGVQEQVIELQNGRVRVTKIDLNNIWSRQ